MTSHVIILPKQRPVIRRKKLSVSEARACAKRPASPVTRPVVQRTPSTSSLASVASSDSIASDLDAHIYLGPIICRSTLGEEE